MTDTATITLKTVNDWMQRFNRTAAPGSECGAWQDFVADSFERYRMSPTDDRAEDVEPSQDFVDYWLDVADQRPGAEYDATGNRIDA